MNNLYICFLLSLLLTSCGRSNESEYNAIELNITNENADFSLPIEDISFKPELIPLETSDSVLIGNVNSVKETRKYFVIVSDYKFIFLFDKAGKFFSKISNEGHGPGEYLGIRTLRVDESNEIMYVMDYFGRQMLKYNFNGEFKGSFPLPEEKYSITGFFIVGDNITTQTL